MKSDEASSHGESSRWRCVILTFDGVAEEQALFRAFKSALACIPARLNATRAIRKQPDLGKQTPDPAKRIARSSLAKGRRNKTIEQLRTAPLWRRFSPRRGAARMARAMSDFSSRIGFKINVVSPFRLLIASGRSRARTNRLLQSSSFSEEKA